MKGNLWTVLAVACALALLIPIVHGGASDAATPDNATESATVDYDTNYNLANDPDTVFEYEAFTVSSGGTQLDRGSDYLVNETAGEIDWQNTTATTDGDSASVEYNFTTLDDTTQNQVDLLATMGSWVGLLVLVVGMGYLIILIGGGSF
jgi:hypothetical protein